MSLSPSPVSGLPCGLLLVVVLVCFASSSARACTVTLVGRAAAASGAPMLSHTDDNGFSATDLRLVRTKARRLRKGEGRPVYQWRNGYPRIVSKDIANDYAPVGGQTEDVPMGRIPVDEEVTTFAYWDLEYGMINEKALAIAESSCTAMTAGWPVNHPSGLGRNLLAIDELTKIALERCATARCAIQLMGDLAVAYGFFGEAGEPSKPDFCDAAEALGIADSKEAWVFNILTGANNSSAIWAAQRVPDDSVTAIANSFTIRQIDFDSPDFMYSPNVEALARKMGWWDGESPFDFFAAYGYSPLRQHKDAPPSPAKEAAAQQERMLQYYSGRRMWRIFNLLSHGNAEAKSLDPNDGNLPVMPKGVVPYPFAIAVENATVRVEDVMDVMRDHYEGTPYDLTKGMAAGPFGNPNRPQKTNPRVVGQWERGISIHRTTWSFVCECGPSLSRSGSDDMTLATAWFGYDAPHGTVYLPFYAASPGDAPQGWRSRTGLQSNFSTDSAWWPFNLANQYASGTNFALINADIREKASGLERDVRAAKATWDARALAAFEDGADPKSILANVSALANDAAMHVHETWTPYAFSLLAKYGQGLVTYNESVSARQEYPDDWLESIDVGFTTWSPEGPFHGIPCVELTGEEPRHDSQSDASRHEEVLATLKAQIAALQRRVDRMVARGGPASPLDVPAHPADAAQA